MSNFGTGSTGNEDLMFSLGLDGLTLVDQLDKTEARAQQSLDKLGGHFQKLKTVIDASGTSNAFRDKIKNTIAPVSNLTTELRALVVQLRQVNSLLTGMSGAGAPAIIRATGHAAAASTVAAGKAAAASIKATGQASAAATVASGKASAAATVATGQASALATAAASRASAAANRAATVSSAAANKIRLSGQTLNQQFQQTGGYLRNISTVLSTIGLGGGIFALIYGFKQLVKDGIDINSQIEQAKISLAAEVVASAKMVEVDGKRVEGLQAIKAVQGQVGEIVGQLKTDALFVNGTFEDLLGIAQSITPQVTRMGGGLQQVHRLTQLTGIAASVLNVEFKTAQTGLSQLLNGNVVGRNAFVRRLPIPIDELKAGLKDVNGRAEFLIKTLARLEDAGPMIMTSFKGAFESMKDLLQQLSGRAFEPLGNRLKGTFNSFISKNVSKAPDGTLKYSQELEATISRVSRLVDTLLAQVTLVARQMFSGGRSFLDVAEETLPKIISGLGSLLSVLAGIGGFLTSHASLVLKLLGYYLTFNLAVGVFNSLMGVVNKVNGMFATMQMLTAGLSGGVTNLRGTIAALAGGLQALATKTIIGVLIVAVMELVNGFMDASQSARDLKLASDDINKLNFDTAIGQIRKMVQELREGQNTWSRFWYTVTHGGPQIRQHAENIDQLTGDAVGKSLGILDSLGVTSGVKRNQFGGLDNHAELANMATYSGKGIEVLRAKQSKLEEEARTASDTRREGIKKELALNAEQQEALRQTLSLLKESVRAEEALKNAAAPGSKEQAEVNRYLKNSSIGLYAAAGRTVPAVEVGLNMAPRTKVTPNHAETPEDANAARQILRNESALITALEQVSQASSRMLDRTHQRLQSEMDLAVQKHLYTVQQAADQETQIAKDTAKAKLDVQEELFNKLSGSGLMNMGGVRTALGAGPGPMSFESLKGISEEQIAKAIADMQGKADTADKTKQAEFTKQIHDLEVLAKIVAAVHGIEEKLGDEIAENARRKAKAEESATDEIKEQNSLMSERAAELAVEEAKLFDITGTLDERIQRERVLTGLIVARSNADIDKKAQKQINDLNAKTNWLPGQKEGAINAINSDAARQKKFQDAKEQIDLQNRLIQLKDQEIEMDSNGTALKEIELGTLKKILGAENPLVAVKENELILEKARTLELQAQARYAAADALEAGGQNTAAKLARNAGNVLMAQAAALREETANFFEILGGGFTQLTGILGKLSGMLGSIGSSFGSLIQQMGTLTKVTSKTYTWDAKANDGRGGVVSQGQGVLAQAGPYGAVAATIMSLWKSFFDMFNSSMKKLIEDAHEKVAKALDDSMNSLRVGEKGLTQTIASLKSQLAHVEDNYPAKKGHAPWWSWFVPLMGAGWELSNHMSDGGRQNAIDEDSANLTRQIAQLAQDAQNALYVLEHETLPALRVTPGMRGFTEQLTKIRKELDGLAQTPGIKQTDLNELFNIRIADLARDLQEQMLDQRQEYLDVLKHEQDLKTQLADLDKEAAAVQSDYASQRAQILGLASRELSKSEQLAKLKLDRQEKLDAIEKRKADLQIQLDYVEKQKAAYEAVYGVVTDIGAYEISIQDQLLAKTQERLTSLSTFFKDVQAWMNGPMWNFITNNGASLVGGNPYALPVVLVNPQPIKSPEPPSNPGGDFGGDQVNYNMYGDIHVNGNMTQSEARQSFLDAWRSFNRNNAVRGLAHSNA